MGFVDESIVVAADVQAAYSLWLDYEQYPRFMRSIDDVSVIGYCRLRWTGRVCDRSEVWEADILEHVEDTRLRWQARDGRETGEVTFEKWEAGTTRVRYQLEYDPAPWGVPEQALRACLRARVGDDLQDFKALIESLD
ncbi:MAG TPA: SRPBCC family protein [Thermoleophilia bacterium]|nr:SRPBCC family protein [Thermoleophilia bacterium]